MINKTGIGGLDGFCPYCDNVLDHDNIETGSSCDLVSLDYCDKCEKYFKTYYNATKWENIEK